MTARSASASNCSPSSTACTADRPGPILQERRRASGACYHLLPESVNHGLREPSIRRKTNGYP